MSIPIDILISMSCYIFKQKGKSLFKKNKTSKKHYSMPDYTV